MAVVPTVVRATMVALPLLYYLMSLATSPIPTIKRDRSLVATGNGGVNDEPIKSLAATCNRRFNNEPIKTGTSSAPHPLTTASQKLLFCSDALPLCSIMSVHGSSASKPLNCKDLSTFDGLNRGGNTPITSSQGTKTTTVEDCAFGSSVARLFRLCIPFERHLFEPRQDFSACEAAYGIGSLGTTRELPAMTSHVDVTIRITFGDHPTEAKTKRFFNQFYAEEICYLIQSHKDFCGCAEGYVTPFSNCYLCPDGSASTNLNSETPFEDTCSALDTYLRYLPVDLCNTTRADDVKRPDVFCG